MFRLVHRTVAAIGASEETRETKDIVDDTEAAIRIMEETGATRRRGDGAARNTVGETEATEDTVGEAGQPQAL